MLSGSMLFDAGCCWCFLRIWMIWSILAPGLDDPNIKFDLVTADGIARLGDLEIDFEEELLEGRVDELVVGLVDRITEVVVVEIIADELVGVVVHEQLGVMVDEVVEGIVEELIEVVDDEQVKGVTDELVEGVVTLVCGLEAKANDGVTEKLVVR
ncbi:hypothetical protein LOTGIDRAFT_171353 [Lottia gigantea]|uniref:Uncharacterized protein n=1 Tax=Lottia gigantea TaxID=225164 RepID=V4B0G5_LOTGI|nr:hypothetical protein LOTGIDRAFT_171353 [Lottia gigantea]ESP03558.1 hypothetical protein LOTGIDRAFT_171353 [Lottia gigantea]